MYAAQRESDYTNPVKGNAFSTEHVCAAIVLAALLFLILIRRGFRGVSLGGASVNLR